jgi:hypothetical protein
LKYAQPTGIGTVAGEKQAISHTYYNIAGVASDKPFNGINIVVTRYTDGSQTTTKIMR